VEGALANNAALAERRDLLVKQAQKQEEALKLAQERVRVGSGDQRAVLQQQLMLYRVLQQQLTLDAQQRIERVKPAACAGRWPGNLIVAPRQASAAREICARVMHRNP